MKRNKRRKIKLFNVATVAILVLVYSFTMCMAFRNNKTLAFRSQLKIQRSYVELEDRKDYIENIQEKYSYSRLFLSFKPLKTTAWFTPEEIERYRLYLIDEIMEKYY